MLGVTAKYWQYDKTWSLSDLFHKGIKALRMNCNEQRTRDTISQGFQFCASNNDDTFLTTGARACLEKVKSFIQ